MKKILSKIWIFINFLVKSTTLSIVFLFCYPFILIKRIKRINVKDTDDFSKRSNIEIYIRLRKYGFSRFEIKFAIDFMYYFVSIFAALLLLEGYNYFTSVVSHNISLFPIYLTIANIIMLIIVIIFSPVLLFVKTDKILKMKYIFRTYSKMLSYYIGFAFLPFVMIYLFFYIPKFFVYSFTDFRPFQLIKIYDENTEEDPDNLFIKLIKKREINEDILEKHELDYDIISRFSFMNSGKVYFDKDFKLKYYFSWLVDLIIESFIFIFILQFLLNIIVYEGCLYNNKKTPHGFVWAQSLMQVDRKNFY
ncbi:MAG: hypothetical protein A2X64_05190 [Ignavibacteria bacterium GWF2_33_9]|nr:MAG: hypothetical protein A2X64_05190 [Ignavibacteria bacterium GWF2_33_9]